MGDVAQSYLILSLDGGGVRGALQARIIERLEDEIPFLHKVELVSGSSIGGVNALALAAGLPPSELVRIFKSQTDDIFARRDWFDAVAGPADEVFRANYGSEGLRSILESAFGGMTLSDLNKKVLITSFDLDNLDERSKSMSIHTYSHRFWKAKMFHNYDTHGGDGAELVVDVGLRTSAAPTFFPSHQGFVDGGIVANNPALCALSRAVKSGVLLDDIVLLSIGTGACPVSIAGEQNDWGYKQWLQYLMPMLMDGMVDLPDYICKQLIPGRYARLHPFLSETVGLDSVKHLDALIEWADDVDLSPAVKLLSEVMT